MPASGWRRLSRRMWVRAGNTPPHLFSSEEWLGMGGTFAIEIADMRNARQVLYGVDPVPTPNASDLRYHAEHEIRQTMRHVRLRLLLAAKEPREIGHLLVSSIAPYMRAAIRLSGQEAPLDTPTVIERAATLIDADPSPLIECHRARGGRAPQPSDLASTRPRVCGVRPTPDGIHRPDRSLNMPTSPCPLAPRANTNPRCP